MLRIFAMVLAIALVSAPALADRKVHFTADFESGQFMPNGDQTDSFIIMTLPDPQVNGEVIRTGDGGGDAASNWDSRVVKSAVIGGQTVSPRNGNYFALQRLHYSKDYRDLNGNDEEKARVALAVPADENRIEYDTEVYAGISIFVPQNFEDETGTKGNLGSSTLLVINSDSSANFLTIRIYVPEGKSRAHWFLTYHVNPDSVEASPRTGKEVDLGPVAPDMGQWTDFVIRFRSNPFSEATNPARKGIRNANNKVYQGNKGILQVWKAEGPTDSTGNRQMVRKLNLLNEPVGHVPGTVQGKSKLAFSLRIYKYKWQTLPTDVRGPIHYGFDAFRFGEVMRDGTGYSDVHPTGQPRPGGTAAAPTRPKPPVLSTSD